MRTKPKKKVDLEQVEEMAAEFCTQEEIADDMGFERTLFRTREDISAAFVRGKNSAKMSLRHMMYNAARSGDRTMMIFLAKNELGYADTPKADASNMDKRDIEDLSPLADLLNPNGNDKSESGEKKPSEPASPYTLEAGETE